MSVTVKKLRLSDVVAVQSRVWSAAPEFSYSRTCPQGTHGRVVAVFDDTFRMKQGGRGHRATVAIVQFEDDDGEYWQTSINVNALTLIRRPRARRTS